MKESMKLFFVFTMMLMLGVFVFNCGGTEEEQDSKIQSDADVTDTEVVPEQDVCAQPDHGDVACQIKDVPPVNDVEDVSDVQKEDIVCIPDCTDKECGSDGCDGICGVCSEEQACVNFKCNTCQEIPSSWGPISYLHKLQIVTAAEKDTLCKDFTGDGKPDNGLGMLATYANESLQGGIDNGAIAIMLEFLDVENWTTDESFNLNGLMGGVTTEPFVFDGEFYVLKSSYQCDGTPYIKFEESAIESSQITAGPGAFFLSIPLQNMDLKLTIKEVEVKGTITDADETAGVDVAEWATITGKIFKDEIMAAVDALDQYCKSCGSDNPECPSPPDECAYVGLMKSLLPNLMDLDPGEDGKNTAMSTCLKFAGKKAKIIGYEPEE